MPSPKLSASLLIYKDLPSAVQRRRASTPGDEDRSAAGWPECGDAMLDTSPEPQPPSEPARAPPALPADDDRGWRFGRIAGIGIAGCGVMVLTVACPFFFGNATGPTNAAISAPPQPTGVTAAPPAEPMSAPLMTAKTAVASADSSQPFEASVPAAGATSLPGKPQPSSAAAAPEPPAAIAAAIDPVAEAPSRLSDEQLAAMLGRGDELLSNGDIVTARLFYERGAEGGDGRAALRLGETYDAAFLTQAGLTAVPGDQTAAARWYRSAQALGVAEAKILLKGIPTATDKAGGN